jgi:NAD(P)-dependent dehydrogenase (short-subunit alcohol dehydrogenase family)
VSNFKDKVALVTGGSRGIGASEVILLAAKGARVLVTDILDDLGAGLAKKITAKGATAAYVHLDCTKTADWARAIRCILQMFGRLDILINNAGVHGRLGLEETSEEEWHRVLDHDLKTAWLGMKHCIPVMRRFGGGAIVNTSSVYGLVASGKATAYHAAKGGVLMISRAAAVEYAQDGIRVNSIHPGIIETPMTDTLPPPWKARLMEATPMKRSGLADEVARAAVFLASDDASFITGTQLIVDGGLTAV